jgi:CBS domain-containing protein
MKVRDIMTKNVVAIQSDTQVGEIARLMSSHDVSGLPVIDDTDAVIGIITELDMIIRHTRLYMPAYLQIWEARIYLETPSHWQERLRRMTGVIAAELMTEPVVTISPEAELEDLAELMVQKRVNPVPVVERGKLVGIVSRSDFIRLMAEEEGGKA